MLTKKFANYRLYMAGITQNKQKLPYFHCDPSRQEKIVIRLDRNGENINIKK